MKEGRKNVSGWRKGRTKKRTMKKTRTEKEQK